MHCFLRGVIGCSHGKRHMRQDLVVCEQDLWAASERNRIFFFFFPP